MFDPVPRPRATFSDLLDRVLDRGVVINADVVISLAGVPLIGLNLRAALAGIETMVQYGASPSWDGAVRVGGLEARGADRARPGDHAPGISPAAW